MARSVHSVRANTRPAARDFAIRLLKPAASALVVLCMSAPVAVASAGVEQGDESFTFGKQDEATLEAAYAAEAQLRRHGLVYEDDALTAYLADVARRLLPEKVPARVTWRFLALRDCMANAYAFPGGSIYVTSGMLALVQTEDQLASILAHEIAHVTGRHIYLVTRQHRRRALAANIVRALGVAVPPGASWSYSTWGTTLWVVSDLVPSILESVAGTRSLTRETLTAIFVRGASPW